jgi:hypothetical protein
MHDLSPVGDVKGDVFVCLDAGADYICLRAVRASNLSYGPRYARGVFLFLLIVLGVCRRYGDHPRVTCSLCRGGDIVRQRSRAPRDVAVSRFLEAFTSITTVPDARPTVEWWFPGISRACHGR